MLASRLSALLVVLPLAVSGLSIAPPMDPCKKWYMDGNTCTGNDVCRLVQVQCITTPCEPVTSCVSSPAPKGGCQYGDPVIDASGNTVPCSGCPGSTKCEGDNTVCCWQNPPLPPCIANFYSCPGGTECVECQDCLNGFTCQKTDYDPCKTHNCPDGTVCDALPTPCPAGSHPSSCYEAACRVIEEPTEKPGSCPPEPPGFGICPVECANDFECTGSKKCCKRQCGILCTDPVFTPEPIPHPCTLVDCETGTECRLQQGGCEEGPCSVEPGCVRVQPSKGTCPEGLPVVDSSNNELSCGALPGNSQCPDATFCETETSVCCHRTKPEPYNPCIAATCPRGYTCEARTPEQCLNPPCKAEPVCIPPETDPCLEANCPRGYHCELIATPCARRDPPQPCPLVAECVKDPEKPGVCPAVPQGSVGTCPELCSNDDDCSGIKKCCSNGCGHVCSDPADSIRHPCTLARCGAETECRLQMNCEKEVCSVGANCVPKKCPYGWPVVGRYNVALFCGKGDNRVDCPSGSTCNTDSLDVCCPDDGVPLVEKCPLGLAAVNSDNEELYCGVGPNNVRCPTGTYCETETDVCCHRSFSEPLKCPRGSPATNGSQEIFCGRGPTRQDCPEGTYCEIHPTDRYAVCCPRPPCELALCKAGYRCEEVVNPCFVAPCPVSAECVLDKNGECPATPLVQTSSDPCPSNCRDDGSCKGTDKCCSNGCGGRTCQRARATFVVSDPCSKRKCNQNKVCRLKKVRCVRGRCSLKPVCLAASSVANSKLCKSGYPLINLKKKEITCNKCPQNSVCDNGVCCWDSKIIIKDGVCPNRIAIPSGCPNECANDNMCSGAQKCCSKGCSRTCQYPVTLASYHASDPCSKKKCQPHAVCQLKERRCRDIHACTPKAICVKQTTVSNSSSCKSGYPVLYRRRREICSHGHQTYCPKGTIVTNSVCCWNTGKPVPTPKVTFGTCPLGPLIGPCVDLCTGDEDCPQAKMCCKHGCGRRCKNPVTPTYLSSDPCKKKTCWGNTVCRLKRKKRCKNCPPVAKCAPKQHVLGAKSCLSGYPVQELGTWRPICCEVDSNVCPPKTVCMAGVCCWDRANDNLKG